MRCRRAWGRTRLCVGDIIAGRRNGRFARAVQFPRGLREAAQLELSGHVVASCRAMASQLSRAAPQQLGVLAPRMNIHGTRKENERLCVLPVERTLTYCLFFQRSRSGRRAISHALPHSRTRCHVAAELTLYGVRRSTCTAARSSLSQSATARSRSAGAPAAYA